MDYQQFGMHWLKQMQVPVSCTLYWLAKVLCESKTKRQIRNDTKNYIEIIKKYSCWKLQVKTRYIKMVVILYVISANYYFN